MNDMLEFSFRYRQSHSCRVTRERSNSNAAAYDTSNADAALPRVYVHKLDALEVALSPDVYTLKPLVLILADAQQPGGCVQAGAGMQEESLFRRSALFAFLRPELYPIGDDEALCAHDVPVLLGTEAMYYAPLEQQPVHVTFLALPAVKLPRLEGGTTRFTPDDARSMTLKIKLLFNTAAKYGNSAVVAGAMGCGAFGCPPRHVAELFREVLTDAHFWSQLNPCIKRVDFAITGNLANIFRDVLC